MSQHEETTDLNMRGSLGKGAPHDARGARDDQREDDRGRDALKDARAQLAESDHDLTDDQRVDLLVSTALQTILPHPPRIRGFHTIWLSTTNNADSITRREILGYSPVKASECPDFRWARPKSGETEGLITVNEMVLYKIPEGLYQKFMRRLHHDLPSEEEGRLKAAVDAVVNRVKNSVAERGDGLTSDYVSAPARFEG